MPFRAFRRVEGRIPAEVDSTENHALLGTNPWDLEGTEHGH